MSSSRKFLRVLFQFQKTARVEFVAARSRFTCNPWQLNRAAELVLHPSDARLNGSALNHLRFLARRQILDFDVASFSALLLRFHFHSVG